MQGQVVINDDRKNLIIMIAAFAAVYLIWGSTYLAIKYAIETLPTFLMAGVRFTVAGAVLFTIARFSKGYEKPKLVHWRTAAIVGMLLLTVGNGAVVVAEHYVSSGLTALLVATVPFWIVIFGWGFFGQDRPNSKVILGLLIGFLGVWMLLPSHNSGPEVVGGMNGQLLGAGIITIGSIGWAIGSLYGARSQSVKSPIQAAGMQMLIGGTVLLIIGTLMGEWSTFDIAAVSFNSWIALGYLITFGAVVAYGAFSWLLRNASPTKVTTYAYVNPAVAVFLGWAIAGETITGTILFGAAIIVGSVALISANKKVKKEEPVIEHDTETPESDIQSGGMSVARA